MAKVYNTNFSTSYVVLEKVVYFVQDSWYDIINDAYMYELISTIDNEIVIFSEEEIESAIEYQELIFLFRQTCSQIWRKRCSR